jgi:anti-sigma-K factor RskA
MDRDTFLDLIPAYALGALDEEEQAEFEALLSQDSEAQALLADYEVVAQTLALTAAGRTAPAHLGDDLRRRVAASRAVPTPEAASTAVKKPPVMRRWLLAAALLLVIVGAAVFVALRQNAVSREICPDTQPLYQQIVASQSSVRLPLLVADEFAGVGGDLFADPRSNAAILHMKNLPVLDSSQTYQLWMAGAGPTVSGGLFNGAGSDTCIVVPLERPLTEYTGFGVSLEQAGGSPNPNGRTGPRVLNVRLADA